MPRKTAKKPALPKVISTGRTPDDANLDAVVRTALVDRVVASTEALVAVTKALTLLIERHQSPAVDPQRADVGTVAPTPPETIPAPQKPARAPRKATVVAPEPSPAEMAAAVLQKAAEHIAPTPAEQIKAIVPLKPSKTLADLMRAAQGCVTKHGMPEAIKRLAPYGKVVEVPEAEIEAVIERLAA